MGIWNYRFHMIGIKATYVDTLSSSLPSVIGIVDSTSSVLAWPRRMSQGSDVVT